MIPFEVFKELAMKTPTRIVVFIIDGLGGLPSPDNGKTELETAQTPNLDKLAASSICGLTDPVRPGITPGSGPAHLSLFGYDPLQYLIGRGALSAVGIGFHLQPNDVAARVNFATVDEQGRVTDRRAGRISTETNRRLVEMLRQIRLPGVETFVETESGHRAVVVLRGPGLSDELTDSDPQVVGQPPKTVEALASGAQKTAQLANDFLAQAARVLKDQHPANMILMRGFAKPPSIPSFYELYKLTPAAIAVYPMYRGLAKLIGMELLDVKGSSLADEIQALRDNFDRYDYFFLHWKAADTAGEDGDFSRKVSVMEEVDAHIPALLALEPDVLVVTGDHRTPSVLRSHSWHPVPFALHSRWVVPDGLPAFNERELARGSLGRFPAMEAMGLMMGYAQKLARYGA